jgi:acyl-CoA reductase-like NAD-dependent aldehyde dehydrogenase
MANAGQSCIGAERVYVHESVSQEFKRIIVEKARHLKPGESYGPATMPSQLAVIDSHIKDAAKRGGKFLFGDSKAVQAPYVMPVIMEDVPEDSLEMTDETFGPTLVINTVKSMNEAILLANNSRYGLGASVWSKRNGNKIASQLRTGMVSINSVFTFAAVPSVPFGGVQDSGSGRIHGPEGLLEMTYPRTVVKTRFKIPLVFTSFKRSAAADRLIMRLIRTLHGRRF